MNVLGVAISAVNLDRAVAELGRWVSDGERRYVCVTGVHGVMESQADPDLMAIHNDSGMTTPDGMPMVWCNRFAGARNTSRVYGPDLLLATCAAAIDPGWRMYFHGGAPGVAALLSRRLADRFGGLQVVGADSPPYRPLRDDEVDAEVRRINATRPDIVWVGLSTPKQERWMAARRPRLTAAALVGVGAAFDIHAGILPQAPHWIRASGLEWAYRLYREPRRLWKRYASNNPRFVWAIVRKPPVMISLPSNSS